MTKPQPKDWILGISPYVPGKAASDDGRKLIKLSANESPLGTSPKAREAFMAATADLATYPDPGAAGLRHGQNPRRLSCQSQQPDGHVFDARRDRPAPRRLAGQCPARHRSGLCRISGA